jgi:glycosyltransferase involved in cell wall biosynthesis
VFIGPVNTTEHTDVGLAQLSNVSFIGARAMDELPAYLQHAHCTMIPFEYSKLTKSIYPLKINEYLGAGMPVVSTRFSEDIAGFQDVIYLADTPEEFAQQLKKAVSEDSEVLRQKRLKVAEANTWKSRGTQFLGIINKYLTV